MAHWPNGPMAHWHGSDCFFVFCFVFSVGNIRNRNINGQGIFSFNTIDDLTLVIIPHFSMFNVQCSMFNVQGSMFNVQCSRFKLSSFSFAIVKTK